MEAFLQLRVPLSDDTSCVKLKEPLICLQFIGSASKAFLFNKAVDLQCVDVPDLGSSLRVRCSRGIHHQIANSAIISFMSWGRCVWALAHMSRSKDTCKSWFTPPTMWVPVVSLVSKCLYLLNHLPLRHLILLEIKKPNSSSPSSSLKTKICL